MSGQITESVIIKGHPGEIFELWSDYEMFPSIIKDIKNIEMLGLQTSRWVVKGPLGKDLEWTAEVTRFDEDRRIGWKTLDGDVKTSGQVTFQELPDNETQVTVMMQYVPPAGKLGEVASKLLANPREKITESLRDIKAYIEDHPERIRKFKDNKG
jgi:uncharacterized membrane protein